MKKFKTESKRILDLMINSIYTHKEIFMRELISNASDAIDKLYYKSLSENLGLSKEDFSISVASDEKSRTITISDNGIGMTKDELDNNLGVIAKSGSFDFKESSGAKEKDIDIIGQFGVGFYSSFMIAKKVEVVSLSYGEDKAYKWASEGTDGYVISESERASHGTTITLFLKDDEEEADYSEFLSTYRIKELVKKYSDYIRYPINMAEENEREIGEEGDKKTEKYTEVVTLNSMTPLWKKRKTEISEEEYNNFYKENFFDYENPLSVIHTSAEGALNYKALLFIPKRASYDYYSKNFEKGLKLFNSSVMIMEKCKELLPDYFSFVKGVVDCDLTLNISRETVQQNYQLKKIADNLEKKIENELKYLLENKKEEYSEFFKEFGRRLKYAIYESFGANKDKLSSLLLFHSLKEDKLVTLKEYVDNMKEGQEHIYYGAGMSNDAVRQLPQAEKILDDGFDILAFTDEIDEFTAKVIINYEGKEFKSISQVENKDETSYEESETDKELVKFIKEALGDKVSKVKLTSRLKSHLACLTAEGELSIEMERVFRSMPNSENISATKVLEINQEHPLYKKLISVFIDDKESVKDYAEVLYQQARLIEGLGIENPSAYTVIVNKLLAL